MNWIYSLAAVAALGAAVKFIPGLLATQEEKLINNLLAQGDDNDDELILAMVKWADKKLPGGQNGHLKYQAVANMVSARFPLIAADKLDALIEAAVDKMKATAEAKVSAGGTPPPGSPA